MLPRRSLICSVREISLRNVLPLDVVTIIASLAAPDPVRKRLGVNARLVSCVIIERGVP